MAKTKKNKVIKSDEKLDEKKSSKKKKKKIEETKKITIWFGTPPDPDEFKGG